MNERDAARARSDSVHEASHDTSDERAARLNRALQNYVAAVYYPAASRGSGRRRDQLHRSRKP